MKNALRLALLVSACAIFLQSGWVCYSQGGKCPWPPEPEQTPDMTVKDNFMSVHGMSQDDFSIWLREHSVWRRENAGELGQFTFIPQDFDTERK